MLSILYVLIPIFGIMTLGAFAERRHLLPPETGKCLNQFVYWFSLPLLLFSIMSQIRFENMAWSVVLGGTIGLLVSQSLATLILRCGPYSWKQSTMGGMTSSFPNVAFMGIPMILLLYPENAEAKIVAGIAAILPTTNLVLTDIALTLQNEKTLNIQHLLKNVWRGLYTNPSLIGASLGACVGLLNIPLPTSLLQIAQMLGNTASPCALFCIGMSVASQLANIGQNKHDIKTAPRTTSLMVFCKLLLSPLIMYACCTTLGVQGIHLAVMTILAGMPTAVLCHIIAAKHEVITNDTTNAILAGTLLSLPSLAIVIAIVQAAIAH